MEIWSILKTEPTRDKDALKRAYRTRLKAVHPEDDPEGFKALREAYEEALRLADTEAGEEAGSQESAAKDGEESFPDTPRGQMEKAMHEIYASFFRRVQLREWEDLLDTPYAASVDTAEDAMYTLLDFLITHCMVPHQVYVFLNRHYDLEERREELVSRYPMRYVDYILTNAFYPDPVDYTKFTGPEDADYDRYLVMIGDFYHAQKGEDLETERKMYPELMELPVKNPGLDVLMVRFLWQDSREQEALDLLERVKTEYPEDEAVLCLKADFLLQDKRADEALEIYQDLRKRFPERRVYGGRVAEAEVVRGDFDKARDILYELMKVDPYDGYYRSELVMACEGIVEEKKPLLKEDTPDHKNRIEMAIAYYQSYHFEEAVKLLEEISPPEGIRGVNYHNYMGRGLLTMRRMEEAERELRLWVQGILSLPDRDESDEAVAVRKRIGYAYTMLGVALIQLNRLDEAQEALQTALSMKGDEYVVTLEEYCVLLYRLGRYDEGIRVCIDIEKKYPRNFQASNIRAKCAYQLGALQDAINYADRAIRIYPYVAEPHLTIALVLLKDKHYKEAEDLAARYEAINPQSDTVRYIRARIAVEKNRGLKKAAALMDTAVKNVQADDTDIEDRESFFLFAGNLYKKLEQPHKALEAYQGAVKADPFSAEALECTGDMHRRLMQFDKALECFLRQELMDRGNRVKLNIGYCLYCLGRYKEARDKIMETLQGEETRRTDALIAARILLEMGCPFEAQKALGLADRAGDPENGEKDSLIRMRCDILLKKYDHARELMDRTGTPGPEVGKLRVKLLMLTGDFSGAERQLRLLEENGLTGAEFYDHLSEICFYSGDIRRLRETVAEAEAKDKEVRGVASAHQYELLGHLLMLQKKYKEAEQVFTLASGKNPAKKFRYYGYMAECAAKQLNGKTRMLRYIANLERTETSSLSKWETKIRLAQGLRAGKTYARAHRLLEDVLEGLPWNGELNETISAAYEELGRLYLAEKKKDKALLAFEQAEASRGVDISLREMIKRLRYDSRN